jgi:MFS family permease
LVKGIGSDFLVKYLHASRGWCLTVAAVLFLMAQVAAVQISTPTYLVFVSSVTGLAYGFLFGVFPSLIAETFGVHGLSQNWGWMTISPVISGTIFNHIYGLVYDSNSDTGENGELKCDAGLDCYKSAYVVTICGCVAGLVISLWSIRHAHVKKALEARGDERLA